MGSTRSAVDSERSSSLLSFLSSPPSIANSPPLFLFFCALPQISVGLPTQRVVTEDFLWNKGDKTADDWLYRGLSLSRSILLSGLAADVVVFVYLPVKVLKDKS